MKTEISAGGVVVRPSRRGWQVLLISDMNSNWTFPKGLINKNEGAQDAARREIQEETGIKQISYLAKLPAIRYLYQRQGLIQKTVHYFLFQISGNPRLLPQKSEGIGAVRWVSFQQAIEIIGYPQTNKPLLKKAQKFLTTYGN